MSYQNIEPIPNLRTDSEITKTKSQLRTLVRQAILNPNLITRHNEQQKGTYLLDSGHDGIQMDFRANELTRGGTQVVFKATQINPATNTLDTYALEFFQGTPDPMLEGSMIETITRLDPSGDPKPVFIERVMLPYAEDLFLGEQRESIEIADALTSHIANTLYNYAGTRGKPIRELEHIYDVTNYTRDSIKLGHVVPHGEIPYFLGPDGDSPVELHGQPQYHQQESIRSQTMRITSKTFEIFLGHPGSFVAFNRDGSISLANYYPSPETDPNFSLSPSITTPEDFGIIMAHIVYAALHRHRNYLEKQSPPPDSSQANASIINLWTLQAGMNNLLQVALHNPLH